MYEKHNAGELSSFLAKMNIVSSSHIGFCGENSEEIYDSLMEDFSEDSISVRYHKDQVIGFLGFDLDGETAEVWGPFVDENFSYQEIAEEMWEELTDRIGINTYLFFINKENQAAKEFIESKGAYWTGDHLILEAKQEHYQKMEYAEIEEYMDTLQQAFIELHDSEFPATYYSASKILTRLNDSNKLFVIPDGDRLKGYVYVEADPSHGEGTIEYIAVHPDYRRQGIGRKLLEKALLFLNKKGQHVITLSVSAEETAAINLYKSAGFQVKYALGAYRKKQTELDKAIGFRKKGEYKKSNELLIQLAADDPSNAYLQYQCAWSFDVLGEEASAVPYYELAIKLGLSGKDLEGALLGLGSTYRTLGRYEESERVLLSGVEKFPDNKAIPVFLAMTYYNLGKTNMAMEILLKTVSSSSTDEEITKYQKAIQFYADKLDTVWS